MLFGRQRKQKPELQRQSSDESYSSTTSPSKTNYRRAALSINDESTSSISQASSSSDVSLNSSTTMATDPLNPSWSSSSSYSLSHVDVDTKDCSVENKIRSTCSSDEAEKSMCVLDLIRQLSFSPSRKTRKRADTADTDVSSSFDTFDSHHEDNTSHNVLLDQIEELRRSTPSPLVGLQYI